MARGTDSKWGPWWTAPCLDTLGAELDKAYPKRKRPDGTIADHNHTRPSDHIPDSEDMVKARDVASAGVNMQTVIHRFINDPYKRSHYVIFNRVIWDRDNGFKPARYLGDNPHTSHGHFSVYGGVKGRDTRPWGISTPSKPAPPGGLSPGMRVLYLTNPQMRGADVLFVQRWIGPAHAGYADGIFGPETERGVRWYQKMRGIKVDGMVGPTTWRHMLGR